MKKSELRESVQELIAEFDAFSRYYNKWRQRLPHLEDINVELLRGMRTSLESRYLPAVETLPDATPTSEEKTNPLEGSAAILEYLKARGIVSEPLPSSPSPQLVEACQACLAEAEREYRTIQSALSEFRRELTKTIGEVKVVVEAGPKTALTEHKEQFEALLAAITSENAAALPYPRRYHLDAQFKSHIDLLEKQRSSFSRVLQMTTLNLERSPDPVVAYQTNIALLQTYQDALHRFQEALQVRGEEVNRLELTYNSLRAQQQALLEKTKPLRTLSSTALTAIAELDPSHQLARKMHAFQSSLSTISAYEKDAEVFLRSHNFDEMAAKIAERTPELETLDRDGTELLQELNSITSSLKETITREHVTFLQKYQELERKLSTPPVNLTAPTLPPIKAKFEQALGETKKGTGDEVVFLYDKFKKLRVIIDQFISESHEVESRIKNKLREEIVTLKSSLQAKKEEALQKIQAGRFNFTHAERTFVRQIQETNFLIGEEFDPSSTASYAYEHHLAAFQALENQQAILTAGCEAIDKIMILHQRAQTSARNFHAFVHDINTHGDAVLLSTMRQYWNPPDEIHFLTEITNNMRLFGPEARRALQQFVESRKASLPEGSPLLTEIEKIEEKLTFIRIASERYINPNPYLDKEANLQAALYFHEKGWDRFIQADILNNDNFCQALAILRHYKITEISQEFLDTLLADPDKCAVICQQESFYQQNKSVSFYKLEEKVFKDLLNAILKFDPEVIQAIQIVNSTPELAPYRSHGIALLLRDNAMLRSIICQQDKLSDSLPFLLPLFEQAFKQPELHLRSYIEDHISSTSEKKVSAQSTVSHYLAPYFNVLPALIAANAKPAACNLREMAILMRQFNTFFTTLSSDANSENERAKLRDFRNDMMPILLKTETLDEKQVHVEKLAHHHFERKKGMLETLLNFIGQVFNSIRSLLGMPVEPPTPEQVDTVKTGTREAFNAAKTAFQTLREPPEPEEEEGERRTL